ncbi:hypothetical protein [Paenibacillus crassostreae]|uniref:PPM-type phosphatase domain-containing protein n=1 Tax=Paenibacillus crassostreae TaxID=1763538 RepID=A0A167FJY2_9BACL|nr:hypothetical protein [Paenibacillus crassostreae]OAB76637.1 hypothetical protein PNBC_04360 [Paenibacillus crassostreae]
MIKNPESIEEFRYISSQAKEQKLSAYQGILTCRYGYGRAMDKAKLGGIGRDFLGVYLEDDNCHFTLCKGIGQNMESGYISRYLGEMLMDWLDTTEDWSSLGFQSYLNSIPPMGGDQEISNQAMYICGRIELPTLERPVGRIWMAWQGDSRLKYWRDELEVSQYFKDTMIAEEWWSDSNKYLSGVPHVYQSRLEYGMPMRLQLYTDGLSDLDPISDILPNEQIQILFDAPHTGGLTDDAAFLELSW